jgi:hypothetical protein
MKRSRRFGSFPKRYTSHFFFRFVSTVNRNESPSSRHHCSLRATSSSLFLRIAIENGARDAPAVMSGVITACIQPRFKARRNVGRRVNVSRFESHGDFRTRGGRQVDRGPRFNPFSRVGGPFVWGIEASRFDSPFLSLSFSLVLLGSVIGAITARIIPLEKARAPFSPRH